MQTTNHSPSPFTIAGIEFKPALGCTGGFLGRISFTMNGHTSFQHLPVFREDHGLRIEFPDVSLCPLPHHIREKVGHQVAAQIEDLVR